MLVHKLDFTDFSSSAYTLIAIHTVLNDYRLAYILNKTLNCEFKRCDFDIDKTEKYTQKHKVKALFSVYRYTSSEYCFFLISNRYKYNNKMCQTTLFSENFSLSYLVPEMKKVNYFIKIEGITENGFLEILKKKINQIPQVSFCYKIDLKTLKSKDFLIF
ncbi:MAG: IPExxxVDY family protein [Tenacibaculum sp.]